MACWSLGVRFARRRPRCWGLDRVKVERGILERLSVIAADPEILGGTPCFRGTRVPVESLDEFLDNFASVSRVAAIAALEEAKALLSGIALGRVQAAGTPLGLDEAIFP